MACRASVPVMRQHAAHTDLQPRRGVVMRVTAFWSCSTTFFRDCACRMPRAVVCGRLSCVIAAVVLPLWSIGICGTTRMDGGRLAMVAWDGERATRETLCLATAVSLVALCSPYRPGPDGSYRRPWLVLRAVGTLAFSRRHNGAVGHVAVSDCGVPHHGYPGFAGLIVRPLEGVNGCVAILGKRAEWRHPICYIYCS
jgi:hypothetical protein